MNSLADQVRQSLSDWKPASGDAVTFGQAFPDAGWQLSIAFEKSESLGGSVQRLELDRTADAPAGLTLNAWAESVANRVSGLLEKLKVHEIDDLEGVAMLRSEGPQVRGTARNYYEVELTGTEKATVERYRGDTTPGSRRERIPFALTYEGIGQVVEGFGS